MYKKIFYPLLLMVLALITLTSFVVINNLKKDIQEIQEEANDLHEEIEVIAKKEIDTQYILIDDLNTRVINILKEQSGVNEDIYYRLKIIEGKNTNVTNQNNESEKNEDLTLNEISANKIYFALKESNLWNELIHEELVRVFENKTLIKIETQAIMDSKVYYYISNYTSNEEFEGWVDSKSIHSIYKNSSIEQEELDYILEYEDTKFNVFEYDIKMIENLLGTDYTTEINEEKGIGINMKYSNLGISFYIDLNTMKPHLVSINSDSIILANGIHVGDDFSEAIKIMSVGMDTELSDNNRSFFNDDSIIVELNSENKKISRIDIYSKGFYE